LNPPLFQQCINTDACLQGGICKEGHTGPLCQICLPGYGKSGNNCSPCGSNATGAVIIFIIISVFIILAIITVRNAAYPTSNQVIFKIVLSNVQIIALVGDFSVHWSSLIKSYLDSYKTGTFGINLFTADDCTLGINIFEWVYIYIALPIFLFFVIIITAFIYKLVKKSAKNLYQFIIRANLVIFFLLYPSVLTACFRVIGCYQVGNTYLVTYDFNKICNTPEHQAVKTLAFIFIIFYGVLTPLAVVVALYLKKRQSEFTKESIFIENSATWSCLGFFYVDFRYEAYYWSFLVQIRKFIVSVILVFVISPSLQVYSTLCIFIALFALQLMYLPYKDKLSNTAESFGILAVIVTMLVGLLYIIVDQVSTGVDIFLLVFNTIVFGALLIIFLRKYVSSIKDFIVKYRKTGKIEPVEMIANAFYNTTNERFIENK